MDTDRNVLFGVMALHAGAIDATQLQEAYSIWNGHRDKSLAEVLESRGWINSEQRSVLEGQVRDRAQPGPDGVGRLTLSGSALSQLPPTLAETFAHELGLDTQPDESRAQRPAGPTLEETAVHTGAVPPEETVDQAFLAGTDATGGQSPTFQVSPGHARMTPLSAPGGTTEKYSRTRIHARGGIGQVWLARDDTLGREVALKELRPDRSHDAVIWARFFEEARITGQLEHPGIVPVYELAKDPETGRSFYTMRFVRGKTLTETIKDYHQKRKRGEARPLDLARLLNVFVGVCNAIAYAHARGVIHRDLKGQNVVLGEFGEVMVLDWGLAKLMSESVPEASVPSAGPVAPPEEELEQTRAGQVLGTPAYMAPEQAEGAIEKLDRRTDIYSLGAMLYEILSGAPPFRAETATEILRKVREEQPVPPRSLNGEAPAALEAICMKAMAKRPEARYQLASDLAQDVQRWLADEPVGAYPEPWSRRLARWAKRHRTAVAAAAAIAAVGVTALGVSTVLIRRERDEARLHRQIARQAVDEMYTEVAESWLEDRSDPLQRKFLDRARAYYQRFAQEHATDPSARQERGRAYQRLGDVLRKLGESAQAEDAYKRAIEVLSGLAGAYPNVAEHRHHLGRAWAHLGALQMARGDYQAANASYRSALGLQTPLVAASPGNARYRLDLARTEKLQGDAFVLTGDLREAERGFRRSLEQSQAVLTQGPDDPDALQAIGATDDALGLLLKRTGKPQEAETAFRDAIAILEPLVAASPTSPRLREALGKSYNSLASLLMNSEHAAEAETALERELAIFQRLQSDFPTRPEYRRTLARSHLNLAILLNQDGKASAARLHYQDAIALNQKLIEEFPEIVQYRVDLAKAYTDLGTLAFTEGDLASAKDLYQEALTRHEALAREFPEAPRHRESIGLVLKNLGVIEWGLGKPAESEALFKRAGEVLERLVAESPENVDYRRLLAESLSQSSPVLARTQGPDQGRAAGERAVALHESIIETAPTLENRRLFARALGNLGEMGGPNAVAVDRRALAIAEALVAEEPSSVEYREGLATIQNNLAELLVKANEPDEAGPLFRQSIEGFGKLAAEYPGQPNFRSMAGYVWSQLGELQRTQGLLSDARASFSQAIAQQRAVLKVNPRHALARANLPQHLRALAGALEAQGDLTAAAEIAEDLRRLDWGGASHRKSAAAVLARCSALAGTDARLPEADRARLAREYSDRSIALLREAIDLGGPRMAPKPDDQDFLAIAKRPEFQELTGAVAPAAKP